ncbi:MAG: acyl-CoA thioesterase [Tidjanibacter sp.]|nr:acyl-CoA thioesterase [Tidjanibacter sp.]
MNTIITAIQQRFADADLLGHVNNVRLQEYFDLGKMEFYHQVLGEKLDWKGQSLILVSIHTEIMAQTRLGDSLEVETFVDKIGTKSIAVFQKLRNSATGAVNATCRSVVVAFDFASQQSIVLPDYWRSAVAEYLAE